MTKFCSHCGASCTEKQTFCFKCGAQLPSAQSGDSACRKPEGPQNGTAGSGAGQQPGMNWFQFIIYFQLLAVAVLDLLGIVSILGVKHYLDAQRGYYAPVDEFISSYGKAAIVCSLVFGAQAVWAIFVWHKLAGYKAGAPKEYLLFLAVSIAVSIGILIWTNAIVNALSGTVGIYPGNGYSGAVSIGGLACNVVMLIINFLYFRKRGYLFDR